MTPISYLKLLFLSVIACCSITSCATYKNISYFKNVGADSTMYTRGEDFDIVGYSSLKIQPDDILKITISTLDPLFNGIANINAGNNIASLPTSFSRSVATGERLEDGYLVNKAGNIDVPILGLIKVGGLTTDEAKNKISKRALELYKDPTVNVRLANFKITVIGEVTRPGTYTVNEERVSVLDALGLSGDLTIYGKRENVMLIRQEGESKKKIVRMDLNDINMMSSPYFYLKQGDVIYVEPGKGKAAATDMASTKTYAIAGSALAVLITLISRIKF